MVGARVDWSDPGRSGAASSPGAGSVGTQTIAGADATEGRCPFLELVRPARGCGTLLRQPLASRGGSTTGLGSWQPHHMCFSHRPWGDGCAICEALWKARSTVEALTFATFSAVPKTLQRVEKPPRALLR